MKKYTALYKRYFSVISKSDDSEKDLYDLLEAIEDNGDGLAITIIDNSNNKMVWFKEFLGEAACQKHVNDFLTKNEKPNHTF